MSEPKGVRDVIFGQNKGRTGRAVCEGKALQSSGIICNDSYVRGIF